MQRVKKQYSLSGVIFDDFVPIFNVLLNSVLSQWWTVFEWIIHIYKDTVYSSHYYYLCETRHFSKLPSLKVWWVYSSAIWEKGKNVVC